MMARGELPLVNLDDRTWQELVDQAKTLIPHYTPEWTDQGPADVGVTLLELFAWLVEGMQYRLNQVPDRTYLALLNLVGITREPPRPASTLLCFTLVPGRPATRIESQFPVGSLQTEQHEAVVFETDEAIDVLPFNLRYALRIDPTLQNVAPNLIQSPLLGMKLPLKNGEAVSFLLGFDAAPPSEFPLRVGTPAARYLLPTTILTVGIDDLNRTLTVASTKAFPATGSFLIQIDNEQCAVVGRGDTAHTNDWTVNRAQNDTVAVSHGANAEVSIPPTKMEWSYPIDPSATLKVVDAKSIRDGTNSLRRSGTVWLPQLGDWMKVKGNALNVGLSNTDPLFEQSAFWLKLQVTANTDLRFFGLEYVLANSVSASHVTTVVDEPTTNITSAALNRAETIDKPWQRIALASGPLYRNPGSTQPYSHLKVVVSEPGRPKKEWAMVEEFPPGPHDCYRLDPVAGTILFGDYDDRIRPGGVGRIPPAGSIITASYRAVGGGEVGNVPPGVLVIPQRRPLTAPTGTNPIQSVSNPGPGKGGADEEPIEETKRRAPALFRVRNRAVTTEDYAYLAKEASTLVRKASALPTPLNWPIWDGKGNFQRLPGHVNVLIVPDASPSDPQPVASADLLLEVQAYLNERRVVTSSLAVLAPQYAPVIINLIVHLFPGPQQDEDFRSSIELQLVRKVQQFLHPLTGGAANDGWEIGQPLMVSTLFGILEPIIGSAGYVAELTVNLPDAARSAGEKALLESIKTKLNPNVGVRLLDYELICSGVENEQVTVRYLV